MSGSPPPWARILSYIRGFNWVQSRIHSVQLVLTSSYSQGRILVTAAIMGIVRSMDIPSKRRGWGTSYCWNIARQLTNDLLSMIPLEPLLNFGSAPWQIHSKWSQILAIFSTSESLLLLNSGKMRASEKSSGLDTSPEWCGCSLNCTGAPSRWTFEDEIR